MPAAGRSRTLAATLVCCLCASAEPLRSEPPFGYEQLREWAQGPVRWLLQPAEERELRRVRSGAEAVNFVERFWRRRDPDPAAPGNRFREQFAERVEAADLLYAENGRRGSLTDRGRALVLLGAPQELRVASRPALRWNPQRGRDRRVVMHDLPMEVWVYHAEKLPEVLSQALVETGAPERIEVAFVVGPQTTKLSRGEELLELAARVVLAKPH